MDIRTAVVWIKFILRDHPSGIDITHPIFLSAPCFGLRVDRIDDFVMRTVVVPTGSDRKIIQICLREFFVQQR